MALTSRLDLRQSQSLVMTPQMQQAIKLLQMSNLELAAFIETELEQNPLLVREDGEAAAGSESPAETQAASSEGGDGGGDDDVEPPDSADMAVADRLGDSDEAPLDTDYENSWEGEDRSMVMGLAAPARAGDGGSFDDGGNRLEQTLERPISLRDHLLAQLEMDCDDPADRLIGRRLIDLVDEAGYLAGDLAPLAEALGCGLERVERTLALLHRFDPPGIFARDLRECLALQLGDRNRLDPAMQALVDNLDLLAKRDAPALRKLCGVDEDDLAEMVAEIRALNPKPGLAFDMAVAHPVTPDVLMWAQNGGWVIELNHETLPRVLFDASYHARVSRGARDRHERDYIAECYQSANWLVRALHQRATTILRVATEIVRQQDAFFTHGVHSLRPLVLRDIAEEVELHESTVSRVTANKYIATPRGIFELKYFFGQAIAGSGGQPEHSAESVRHRIRALIDAENREAVLSDDGIAEILRSEGVDIARRTVAKYRESLRIPSSQQRRREKTMSL